MDQRYNDNTKMLKPKENQLGILKTGDLKHFAWKFSRGPWESATGVTYLWEYTQRVATSSR